MVSQHQREHVEELRSICRDHGAAMQLVRQNGGHQVWDVIQAEGTTRFVTANTPSDRRGRKNSKARLRRILKHGPPPEPETPKAAKGTSNGKHASEAMSEPKTQANGNGPAAVDHGRAAEAPAGVGETGMSGLVEAVAAQLEGQIQGQVHDRVAKIVGELDILLEERGHALQMLSEMDAKIADRLRALRAASGAAPAATAQTPRPSEPEPEPAAPIPNYPPPPTYPPAEAEPEPEPEPADAARFQGMSVSAALVAIAEENDGILRTRDATEELDALGYFDGKKTRPSHLVASSAGTCPHFEWVERGVYRLLPETKASARRSGAPHFAAGPGVKSEETLRLEAAVLEATRDQTGSFAALKLRDTLMNGSAAIGTPAQMSVRLSHLLKDSPHFEWVARGVWRRVPPPSDTAGAETAQ